MVSNFAKNRENFKQELCLNIIIIFSLLSVVLSLRDAPQKYFEKQKWEAQAVVREARPPGSPVATALNTSLLLNVKRQMPNLLGKKPMLRKNRTQSLMQTLCIQKEK